MPIDKGALANPIKGSATLTEQQVTDLMSGQWYFNIHTAQNPTGEIRGQVLPAKSVSWAVKILLPVGKVRLLIDQEPSLCTVAVPTTVWLGPTTPLRTWKTSTPAIPVLPAVVGSARSAA